MNKLTLTILLVGLFAAAALARTSPQIRRPFKFAPGQTYIYEYRGRQWNGLPKLADQYSGLTLDCDVILQARPESLGKEILMKLDDIKVEQLHTQALDNNDIRKLNQGSEVNGRQLTMYKDELSKPIRFTYVDGKVLRFVAETSEPEWSINIKKSILSMFQLDLAPTKIIKSPTKLVAEQYMASPQAEQLIRDTNEMPLVYPIYEESFGGICETQYELDSVDNVESRKQQDIVEFNDVLNVTKTVNFKNCLTDPSISYDRHSFNVNTQTIKGKLFSKQPIVDFSQTIVSSQFYPVPEELKQKYSNAYTSLDGDNNVASPVPVERHSYTKYNITTVPQIVMVRRNGSPVVAPTQSQQQMPSDMLIIEGVYSESKIKYEADGDLIISDTQQSLKLITCSPTNELARIAPEAAQLQQVSVKSPSVEYQTIQCELSTQKLKFYQALWKYAQVQASLKQTSSVSSSSALYSHKLALPFALSASWYPIVATGEQSLEQPNLDRAIDPDQLAKSYETLLVSLAEDVLAEDVAQSKKAGEKVVRLINTVAFMPKHKLVEVYDRIVGHIQQAKQQQQMSRGKQAIIDNEEVSKWKVVRKLCLDSLPLAGSKQAIEMIELLIESNRVKPFEAKEMCEAVPANLRYPDTEIIDAFIRLIQLPQVRKSRSLFASCSIAVGKMIGQAYAKSKDASYKPTTYEQENKLPSHLREDDLVKQVVEEADPRRQLPINWNSPVESELYERLVLDEQDLTKYIMLIKQMLTKSTTYHEKVIFLETLAHMKVPQVLPILEPFVTGRLSLAQCLGNQPLDLERPIEQSQWYNYYSRSARNQLNKRQVYQRLQTEQTSTENKDWNSEDSYGAEECNYMRTIAIYAMAHVARWAPNKVQTLLMPVFDNTYEPYQIRIAAFTTMMLTPVEEHILERIASQMWREPNKEVASFVVGFIDTMSKMTSPSVAAHQYAAQKASESMPKQYLDTYRYSWIAGGDHFDKKKQTGVAWIAELVKSNVSSIPRAAYVHVGRQHGVAGSKYDNHFELGFTSKGLEALLKEYLAYNKQNPSEDTNIVASIFENLYDAKEDIVKYYFEARDQIKSGLLGGQQLRLSASSADGSKPEQLVDNYFFKRQQPIDGVNSHAGKKERTVSQMFEGAQQSRSKRSITVQARRASSLEEEDAQEEPKLTLFSKVFDSTSYHAMDKRQLLNLIEKADDYIKMTADELIMGGKLHYVKMMMPSNMWHVVPSALGLPIVVTHRSPIIASIKIDGAHNGQLTSNKLSQYLRQQATQGQVPNVQGQNFATFDGINITALVHPKIMHSNLRFMFACEQANNEAYGVQIEKSHQLSLPMEVSVAYSRPKDLVSIAVEPKTPARVVYTKEAAKTFIGPISLSGSQSTEWLGQQHLIRVPSQQSQYKRLSRSASFVPSLLAGVQNLLNEPKEKQMIAIEELETPYKFEHRFLQQLLGLELYLEGATDDEDVTRVMNKPELSPKNRGQLQWTSTEEVDDLDQHSKSGPFAELLHTVDSALNRQCKYLEFYTTLKPDQPHKSPVYRVDFLLNNKDDQSSSIKFNNIYKQKTLANTVEGGLYPRRGANSRLDINNVAQEARLYDAYEQNKKLNQFNRQQILATEVY